MFRRPEKSCASRCHDECSGIDVASCILHCSTPGCHPACCGSCSPSDPCAAGAVPEWMDAATWLIAQGATVEQVLRLHDAARHFAERTEKFARLHR